MNKKYLFVNGKKIYYNGERNLLEVIRNANIEIPTFCYHSELSVYGACRLCLVEVDGRGILASCSIKPEEGMNIKTHTSQIRNLRKISVELLLANHRQECNTCAKNINCKLQELAKQLGVEEIRYKRAEKKMPLDNSSSALIRDPNKCILCGDCVRACEEIQNIGAIDFAYRGTDASVLPAFGKNLEQVECVDCGQCARVCPTGAITPKPEIENVWKDLDSGKKVIAQIAPAVRVALGEEFGLPAGEIVTGKIVAALKLLGFDRVYDTAFAADLTVVEEAHEFLKRRETRKPLPLFTSCCPGWVRYCEQYYPEFLENLSSCRSPQQMFGSLGKHVLSEQWAVPKSTLSMVAIMPCTAKKWEAKRDEFQDTDGADVDHVLTTQELAQMIRQAGIRFDQLQPESMDMPLGFKTGAGVIFGTTGGVSEAVARYLIGKDYISQIHEKRDEKNNSTFREMELVINKETVRLAIVQGLRAAGELMDQIKSGSVNYDLIEVMACPGGCAGGAGQPVQYHGLQTENRREAILETDRMLQLHNSGNNPYIQEVYQQFLEKPGSSMAHRLLHTSYHSRKRLLNSDLSLILGENSQKLEVKVCLGTSCYLRGGQDLLNGITKFSKNNGLDEQLDVQATFCLEKCDKGPSVQMNGKKYHHCNLDMVKDTIRKELQEKPEFIPVEVELQ